MNGVPEDRPRPGGQLEDKIHCPWPGSPLALTSYRVHSVHNGRKWNLRLTFSVRPLLAGMSVTIISCRHDMPPNIILRHLKTLSSRFKLSFVRLLYFAINLQFA